MYRTFYSAFIDYLEMLLKTASPDDIQFFTEHVFKVYCFNILSFNFIFLFNGLIVMILCFQLIEHGQVLNTVCHNKLKDLMIIARQVLLKENLPLTSRRFLLYAVDLENRNFGQLSTNLLKFYVSQFTEHFIEKDKYIVDFLINMNLKDGNCK